MRSNCACIVENMTESQCGATLDIDMVPSHSEEEGEEETDGGDVWGRLFPVEKGFVAQGVSSIIQGLSVELQIPVHTASSLSL